jgi:hypothetical protein
MRVMVFCFLVLISVKSKADEVVDFELPLTQGTWNLGVNSLLSYNSHPGLGVRWEGEFQYFVADDLAFGLIGFHEDTTRMKHQSLGVVGTYYFYKLSKSAFYLSQSISWARIDYDAWTGAEKYLNTRTTLGYNYFLNPNVAFGPRVEYEWDSGEGRANNTLSLGVGLSVFF